MADEFQFDVFLSHSNEDKVAVRDIAKRLREAGLRIWFDEWIFNSDDRILEKTEQGLDRSRALVLCMSANAFGPDWAELESETFRFRDPLNTERRFVPLRLDDAPTKDSLAQFYIDWQKEDKVGEFKKLVEACRPPLELSPTPDFASQTYIQGNAVSRLSRDTIWT